MKIKSLFISIMFLCTLISITTTNVEARTIQTDEYGSYEYSNKETKFSIRAQTSELTGSATEIVYDSSLSDGLLSELTWDIDELRMAGLGFSMQNEWVAIHTDVWYKTGYGDGMMDDYDWVVAGPDWSDWSHHDDTKITEASIYDINAELLIPKLSGAKFALSGFLGYKRERFKWQARGGSYIYSNMGWRNDVGNFNASSLGISYRQTISTPYLGLGLRAKLWKLEVAGRVIASRWARLRAEDNHHARTMYTVANMRRGDMLSYDATGTFNFTNNFGLEVGYVYTKYDTMRSSSDYHWSNGAVSTYVNGEGADLETSMLTIKAVYTF